MSLLGIACESPKPVGVSVREQMLVGPTSGTPKTATQPAASRPTETGVAVASVNGSVIQRQELIDLLIRTKGLPVLQQLLLREAVKREAQRRGVSVSDADVDREYDITLQAEHMNGKDIENLTPARREQLVDEWTQSRSVSREELRLAMQRQATLRKLVEPTVQIDEAMLHKEYDRVHGEKVEVRHLQLAAPRFFPQIKERLDHGEPFEDLVRQFSQNSLSRDRGGLLPPFNANDDTAPAVFVKAAFALQPGQYTNPIEAEGSYHVLKVERRIPADLTPFEQVKDTVRRRLHARLVMQAVQDLSARLLMQAEVRICDPVLHKEYDSLRTAGRITGPPLVGP